MKKKCFPYSKREFCKKVNNNIPIMGIEPNNISTVYGITNCMSNEEINRNIIDYDGKKSIYCMVLKNIDDSVMSYASGVWEDDKGYYVIYDKEYMGVFNL